MTVPSSVMLQVNWSEEINEPAIATEGPGAPGAGGGTMKTALVCSVPVPSRLKVMTPSSLCEFKNTLLLGNGVRMVVNPRSEVRQVLVPVEAYSR